MTQLAAEATDIYKAGGAIVTPSAALVTSFVDGWLGHSSHLVDLGDGSALAVDPARIPTAQLDAALARGLVLAYTADTHTHADYISGSPDLAAEGATFIAPAAADLDRAYEGVADGETLRLGRFDLTAIATPGHTPDHLSYLLSAAGRPVALFSGGSLLVGTVGRTDLLGDGQRDPLARQLYQSLHDRIMVLPDDLPVYPTHGDGSFCAAPGGGETTTTIGKERATNPLVAARSEQEFVDLLLAGFGPFPPYFRRLPAINQVGLTHHASVPALQSITAAEAAMIVEAGGVVVDVRPADDFARAHIPGSLSIVLRSVFASWFGWLIPLDTPVVFVLDDDQDESELVRYCLTIGHDQLAGRLTGGVAQWSASGSQTASMPLIPVAQLPMDRPLIDVRAAAEYASEHVSAAINIVLNDLLDARVPAHPVLMCGKVERAMTGASLLARRGHEHVAVLDGGYTAWQQAANRRLSTK